jgi:hypothetical protein
MNHSDHSLDRLLRAAAQNRSTTVAANESEPPFGFTTRVISAWLADAARDRTGLEALWFRRAFLCAVAVMAISVSWSYKTDTTAPNDEVAIASYDPASTDLP